MTAPRSILVVGAGLAGARCAETLRAEGYGGRLVVVGDETLGTLRASCALEGVPRGPEDRGRVVASAARTMDRSGHRPEIGRAGRSHRPGPPSGDDVD